MRLYLLEAALILGLGAGTSAAQAQQLAFTFDDLPSHGDLPPGETRLQVAESVLKTLKAEKMAPVYGFINGVRIEQSPSSLAVLTAWRAAGEPLGSHSFTHPDLEAETPAEFEADIAKNEPLLQHLMGDEGAWRWFRYPYLHEGETPEKHRAVRTYLKEHRYQVAEVSVDFEDYLWNNPYARCMTNGDAKSIEYLRTSYLAIADQYLTLFRDLSMTLYGHDIPYVLLLHLGAFDAKMLPELIGLYRSKGFTFVPLPEAQKDAAYAIDPDLGVKTGGALQEQMMTARKLKFSGPQKPYEELEAICPVAKK